MSHLSILLHYHDLRTSDHPALTALANHGSTILPLFVYDEINLRRLGGASRWWLHHALERLINQYQDLGCRLQIIHGNTLDFANVWEVDYDKSLDSNKIRSSTGISLNWFSPIGPFTFSYAIPLSEADTDITEKFRFQIGTSF